MKELAESLKIDKDKIGILGFSAGGWLSERIAIKSTEAKEPIDWKPAFVGLIYHGNTLSNFKKIDNVAALPPVFMAIARDDKKMPVKEIIPGLAAIVAEVDHSELHIYSKGNHGFGLAYDKRSFSFPMERQFLQLVVGYLQQVIPKTNIIQTNYLSSPPAPLLWRGVLSDYIIFVFGINCLEYLCQSLKL